MVFVNTSWTHWSRTLGRKTFPRHWKVGAPRKTKLHGKQLKSWSWPNYSNWPTTPVLNTHWMSLSSSEHGWSLFAVKSSIKASPALRSYETIFLEVNLLAVPLTAVKSLLLQFCTPNCLKQAYWPSDQPKALLKGLSSDLSEKHDRHHMWGRQTRQRGQMHKWPTIWRQSGALEVWA